MTNTSIKKVMKLYQKQRVVHLVKQFHAMFEKKKFIWYDKLPPIKGSKMTVIKARRALGIRSQKISKRWKWYRPTIPLDKALRSFGRAGNLYRTRESYEEQKRKGVPMYVQLLTDTMVDSTEHPPYVCPQKLAIQMMREYQAKRTAFIYAAKKALNIRTYKYKGEWLWVYPAEEVTDRLLPYLAHGPVLREELVAKSGMHPGLIEIIVTAKDTPIHRHRKDGKMYFYDINTWGPKREKSDARNDVDR